MSISDLVDEGNILELICPNSTVRCVLFSKGQQVSMNNTEINMTFYCALRRTLDATPQQANLASVP